MGLLSWQYNAIDCVCVLRYHSDSLHVTVFVNLPIILQRSLGKYRVTKGLSTSQLQSISSKIKLLPNSFVKHRRENKESMILKEDFVKRSEKWNTHFDKYVWSEKEYFEKIRKGVVWRSPKGRTLKTSEREYFEEVQKGVFWKGTKGSTLKRSESEYFEEVRKGILSRGSKGNNFKRSERVYFEEVRMGVLSRGPKEEMKIKI